MRALRAALFAAAAGVLLGWPAVPAGAFGSGERGTAAAQFLKLSPGARDAAMGSAFSAVADDVTASFYNPAGLGSIRGIEVAGMHNSHFQGFNQNFGAAAVPILSWVDTRRSRNDLGVLAVSLASLTVDGIERRGVVETDSPDGTFGAGDFAYGLAYGVRVSGGWHAGLGLKVLDLSIDSAHARSAAFDAGVLRREGRWSCAAGFRNMGGRVRFKTASDPLPFAGYAGAGFFPAKGWTTAIELRLPRDNDVGYAVGGEWRRDIVEGLSGALRAGYNSATAEAEGIGGWTMGAGVAVRGLELDFAWVPYGDLGHTFRYAFLYKF